MGGYLGHVASLPSGRPEICLIREKILSLLPGCIRTDSAPLTAPFIAHSSDEQFLNRAECIYVGCGASPASFSPWCMPLPCESFENNKNFILMRADLHIFLRPLSKKIISCSCTSSDVCWDEFIQCLFIDVFDLEHDDIYSPALMYVDGPPESDTDNEDVSEPPGSRTIQTSMSSLSGPRVPDKLAHIGRNPVERCSFDVSDATGRHRDLMSGGVQGARGRPANLYVTASRPTPICIGPYCWHTHTKRIVALLPLWSTH